jgi:DNA polymerase III epsilon subunit-like protein
MYLNTKDVQLPELPPYTLEDKKAQYKNNRVFLASDLTNYLPSPAIFEAHSYLNVKTICPPETKIPLVSVIQTGPKHWESVADLNGIAVPALYEWRAKKSMRVSSLDQETVYKEGGAYIKRYLEIQELVSTHTEPPISLILEAANIFNAIFSGYHYKVAQIKDYTWMTTNEIEPCMEILNDHIDREDTQYEVVIPEQICKQATIRGRVDAYSEESSTLWEIKCTDSLDMTHDIQLAVYAWMFSKAYPSRFSEISFHLLNIRTGECRKIVTSAANLESMMNYLIAEKTRVLAKQTDDEFISTFAAKFDALNIITAKVTALDMVRVKHDQPNFIEDNEAPKPKKIRVSKKPSPKASNSSAEDPSKSEPSPPQEDTNMIVEAPAAEQLPESVPTGKVLVFDLETTGLPRTPSFGTYYPPTELDKYREARIVQWSWSLHEADGTLIVEEDHIIKPNFAEYRIMNTQFHGITEDIARVRGKMFNEVLDRWSQHLTDATTIVGHNVNFDKHVLLSELHRRGFTQSAEDLLKKSWVCTMTRAKELCGLKASNKLKPPKLRELMHALGVQEEAGRAFHNSKHDVYYTARCYFAEQVLKNASPKMYEGRYAGKTYDEILQLDMPYVANAMAVCNVRKLYSSPLRKLSNWGKTKVAVTPGLAELVAQKETEVRNMTT